MRQHQRYEAANTSPPTRSSSFYLRDSEAAMAPATAPLLGQFWTSPVVRLRDTK
jgi:hypothetical protein